MAMDGRQDDDAGVRDWFARFGRCVAGVDFAGGRALFDASVVGFGTYQDVVTGLDALEAGQWRCVWPAIEDFRFELDTLQVIAGGDGTLAVGIVTWSSTDIGPDGVRFHRPGRATVVLRRGTDGQWRGVHTHFSLQPARHPVRGTT